MFGGFLMDPKPSRKPKGVPRNVARELTPLVRVVMRAYDSYEEGDYHGWAQSSDGTDAFLAYHNAVRKLYPWMYVDWVTDESGWICNIEVHTGMWGPVTLPIPDPEDSSAKAVRGIIHELWALTDGSHRGYTLGQAQGLTRHAAAILNALASVSSVKCHEHQDCKGDADLGEACGAGAFRAALVHINAALAALTPPGLYAPR